MTTPPLPSKIFLSSSSITTPSHTLVYFIPGNPGLSAFYTPFLNFLHSQISPHHDIYAQDLLGFTIPNNNNSNDNDRNTKKNHVAFSLEDQIQHTLLTLSSLNTPQKYTSIILIGHSVGAYIATESLNRIIITSTTTLPSYSTILLFPTLTHISLSPSGRIFTLLRTFLPIFFTPSFSHLILLPLATLLIPFLSLITRRSNHSAQAVVVIKAWLTSPMGIWQTIYLAMCEMDTIKDDVWGEKLWEKGGRFYALFARRDHWVDDDERDEFVRRRAAGEGGGGVKVEIDDGGIPHAFCTREETSYQVSKTVSGWINEIDCVVNAS